jgi:pyruvate dehydrogenase complex dehydrogenase (E1) component
MHLFSTPATATAATTRWINEVLAKRDTGGKVVNIRADSSRGHDVSWLVPAIEDVGGRAYQFDSSCKIEIPDRL